MRELIKKILNEQLNQIKWVKPKFETELGEFERFLSETINLPIHLNPYSNPQKSWDVIISNLKEIYESSSMEILSDEEWYQMENTDSWDIDTEENLYNVIGRYGRDRDRILKHTIEPLKSGGIVETPIVVYLKDDNPTLVAGNTRLSTCKVLGIRPMVTKVYL